MQKIFEPLMINAYSLELPMPVVSTTELHLIVEKNTTYVGAIEIYNRGEGNLVGMVESLQHIVKIKDPLLDETTKAIVYNIETYQLKEDEFYEDVILVTYQGGELMLPVYLQVEASKDNTIKSHLKPKPIPPQLQIEFNQLSYNPDEIGLITINNSYKHAIKIKIVSEDSAVQFKENELDVIGTKQVEFSFKISKFDKMRGKIPLKTHPKIEMKLLFEVQEDQRIIQQTLTTYLTELKIIPTETLLTSKEAYKRWMIELCRAYRDTALSPTKNKSFEPYLEKLKAAINYNKADILMRLFYCYVALESNKNNAAMKEINDIDRFLLYYDQEHLDVSDLCMLFVQMHKGENIQELISKWKPIRRDNWFKILLKNRLLIQKHTCYEDYKTLYTMGVKNVLIFTETVVLLNHTPVVPMENDVFYKALIRWAIHRNALGAKWLKKLEMGLHLVVKYEHLDVTLAEKLFLLDDNKNMLKLITSVYLQEKKCDYKAYQIYAKGLRERLFLPELQQLYVASAYACQEPLDLEYFKVIFQPEKLEVTLQSYFYLNLLVQKESYKSLYQYFEKKILEQSPMCFRAFDVPQDLEEKIHYIAYLIKTNQITHLKDLVLEEKLEALPDPLMLEILRLVGEAEPEIAKGLAIKAYSKGIYDQNSLRILQEAYKGTLAELLQLNEILGAHQLFCEKLFVEILFKGILTRKYPEKILELYTAYCTANNSELYSKWVKPYLAAQILIEEYQPSQPMIKLLEAAVMEETDHTLALALLKSYTKSAIRNPAIIQLLIHKLIEENIIFSWYALLVPEQLLGERKRLYQSFEYHSQPDRSVTFFYRLEEEAQYNSLPMKHITLGLYSVNVIMFYHDKIQFYIEELGKDGKRDIKHSDMYEKMDIIEQEGAGSLFDLINTIEICKEMNDEVSLEQTIENYILFSSKEIEKVKLL